jgi:hypothetical protein
MTKQEMIDRYGEEYYRNHLKKVSAHNKERYKTDTEYRERTSAYTSAYHMERYNRDLEYRERINANNNLRNKARYKSDIEYRERIKAKCNIYNKERYCSESLEEIENYERAKADNFEGWELHHRLEINEYGKVRFTMKQLKKFGLYYNRPASELIWLTISEHRRVHAISRRKDV